VSRLITLFVLLVFASPALFTAEQQPLGAAATSAEPFKLGTFEIEGEPRVGLVLQDKYVVELNAANRLLEISPQYPHMPMPLAPLMYPGKILNAAGNFYSHLNETGTPEEQKKAAEERRAKRGVPYLFLKPAEGAVIGQGDAIVLPTGRDRIDWEVELSTVIGRAAKYVPATEAEQHIFGYMMMLDISDRGGRPPGGFSGGTDWFVGKGHDTFAPMGPWIVPKEFYGDPMKRLRQTLSVGTTQMQEATAGDMIHSVYEVIEYASSIITLFPGDVVNAGTSGGVGMGTAVRGKATFLKPGDEVVATIDGIGTLRLQVKAETAPAPGTGSYLPPVSTYRKPTP
jgi:2-keto-4-pentenoate hydratase/2-oxohepta-3-ene-1,7-dioic acid hydratase in catechol pathway